MKDIQIGISAKSCKECEVMDCAIRVMRALQFRTSNGTFGITKEINFRSALGFDRFRQEIVINEDLLMQAIILANPGQEPKKIRLVRPEEYNHFIGRRPEAPPDI